MQKARTAFGAAWEEADDFSDGEEHEAGTDKVVSCNRITAMTLATERSTKPVPTKWFPATE